MQEEIIEIKFKKKYITIVFNSFKIDISKDTYLDNYFYVGKSLDKSEIDKLKEKEKQIKVNNYLNNILYRYSYSYKQIKIKLKQKYKLNDEVIDEVLKPYVDSNLISNKNYAYILIDSLYLKNYSKEYILDRINKEEIIVGSDIISYIEQTCIYNKEFFFNIISKLDLRFKSYPINKRKDKIIDYFYKHGFFNQEYKSFLNDFYLNKKDDDIYKKIEKDYIKINNQLINKQLSEYERKNKIISKLLNKGYLIDDINFYIKNITMLK